MGAAGERVPDATRRAGRSGSAERGCCVSFIVTSNGDELSLDVPRRGHITALDIAWSLAQTNRFSGRCIRPYSVAEHSLLVCEILERDMGLNVHAQLARVQRAAAASLELVAVRLRVDPREDALQLHRGRFLDGPDGSVRDGE